MKAFLLLLTFVFTCTAGEWQWRLWEAPSRALLYDGTGAAFTLQVGAVCPVSRLISRAELDREDLAEFPVVEFYAVIPLASGHCAIIPLTAGRWVNPGDPAVAEALAGWKEYDAELFTRARAVASAAAAKPPLGSSVNMSKPHSQTSSQRYYERKADRQAAERANAEAVARARARDQWNRSVQTQQTLEEINANLRRLTR